MTRSQMPASFDREIETPKINKRLEELGLKSHYAYIRWVVLTDIGIDPHGKTRSKQASKKSKRNALRTPIPIQRDVRETEQDFINDIDTSE